MGNGKGFHTRNYRNGPVLKCQRVNKRKMGLYTSFRCGFEVLNFDNLYGLLCTSDSAWSLTSTH